MNWKIIIESYKIAIISCWRISHMGSAFTFLQWFKPKTWNDKQKHILYNMNVIAPHKGNCFKYTVSSKFLNLGNLFFIDMHVPLQHFNKWTCTPKISYDIMFYHDYSQIYLSISI